MIKRDYEQKIAIRSLNHKEFRSKVNFFPTNVVLTENPRDQKEVCSFTGEFMPQENFESQESLTAAFVPLFRINHPLNTT